MRRSIGIGVLTAMLCFLLVPNSVSAAGGFSGIADVIGEAIDGYVVPPSIPTIDEGISPIDKIQIMFLHLVDLILFIAGIAAVMMIVFAGVRMTFSMGNEQQIVSARKTLLHSIIGLIVIFCSLIVVRTVLILFYGEDLP